MTNHAQEAIGWIDYSSDLNPDVDNRAMHSAQLAQAQATLALVEQQRIANLIGLGSLQILSDDGHGALVGNGSQFRALYPQGPGTPLAPEIAAALGITEGS